MQKRRSMNLCIINNNNKPKIDRGNEYVYRTIKEYMILGV